MEYLKGKYHCTFDLLFGLESIVSQLTIFVFICNTDYYKPVKQEVNGTVILPPLVFPELSYLCRAAQGGQGK
jgi:hypothetical protein